MSGSTLLLIHNIGYAVDSVLLIVFIIFLLTKERTPITVMLSMVLASVFVFTVSQLIGVNVADPHLSRNILMFNTCNLFISCFTLHFVVLFLGKAKQQKPALIVFYTVSIALFIFYMVFPDTFLLDSVPKLYFPNYYVAGSLDWAMRLLNAVIIPAYFSVLLFLAYRKSDPSMKNRIKYLFAGIIFGYGFGSTAIPLVFTSNPVLFGIYFDPVYSILFVPFFVVSYTYAILKYNLFDINIIAKRAFVYGLFVVIVGLAIALLNYVNELLLSDYPTFPSWILPAVSAIIAVSIGFIVWTKLRESDALKSEFITIVTHKFRTPLTQIRWATENLAPNVSENDKDSLVEIERASGRLVDLTDLLVRLSDSDTTEYNFHPKPMRVDALIEDMKPEYERRAGLKGVKFTFSGSSTQNVLLDETQTRFVVQTLFDNAISYTPKDGTIVVNIKEEGSGKKSAVVLSVTDSGIGLSKEEAGRIFEKFWRSGEARKADTEGMGIGLFMSRRIIERAGGGSLHVQSGGLGKGTTFLMRLPVAQA